jgi:hypothetical protein
VTELILKYSSCILVPVWSLTSYKGYICLGYGCKKVVCYELWKKLLWARNCKKTKSCLVKFFHSKAAKNKFKGIFNVALKIAKSCWLDWILWFGFWLLEGKIHILKSKPNILKIWSQCDERTKQKYDNNNTWLVGCPCVATAHNNTHINYPPKRSQCFLLIVSVLRIIFFMNTRVP